MSTGISFSGFSVRINLFSSFLLVLVNTCFLFFLLGNEALLNRAAALLLFSESEAVPDGDDSTITGVSEPKLAYLFRESSRGITDPLLLLNFVAQRFQPSLVPKFV